MPMKKHKPEQIVALLRQLEVEIANVKTTPQRLQGSRNHGADELPLEKRARRTDAGSRAKNLSQLGLIARARASSVGP